MAKITKGDDGFWHTRIDYYDAQHNRHFKRLKAKSKRELSTIAALYQAEHEQKYDVTKTTSVIHF